MRTYIEAEEEIGWRKRGVGRAGPKRGERKRKGKSGGRGEGGGKDRGWKGREKETREERKRRVPSVMLYPLTKGSCPNSGKDVGIREAFGAIPMRDTSCPQPS